MKVLRLFWQIGEIAPVLPDVIWEIADAADALGMTVKEARNKFCGAKATRKLGRLHYISRGTLKRVFPLEWPTIAGRLGAVKTRPWSIERTRDRFIRAGIARRIGRLYFVSRDGLRRAFPDDWIDVVRLLPE